MINFSLGDYNVKMVYGLHADLLTIIEVIAVKAAQQAHGPFPVPEQLKETRHGIITPFLSLTIIIACTLTLRSCTD